MRVRRLASLPIALTAVVLLGTVARSATVEDERQRLDTLLYFVSESDRAWPQMLDEIDATVTRLGELSGDELRPVHLLRDAALWQRAEALGASADAVVHEDRRIELYRRVAVDGVDGDRQAEARMRLADIHIVRGERAEAAGDDAAALESYLLATRNAPAYEAGFVKVGSIGIKQALAQKQAQEFEATLATLKDVLESIEQGLPAGHPSVEQAQSIRADVLQNTGVLSLRAIGNVARLEAVRGGKTDFRTGEIRLTPGDGSAPPPVVAVASPRRVRAGRYDALVSGAGGDETVRATVEVDASGGTVTVPALIPHGMVWVRAGGDDPSSSFLCDRTEVSNTRYAEFAGANGRTAKRGDANAAAVDVSYDDAVAYAKWVGKQLPTADQWRQTAFGADPRSPRYPWGDEKGTPDVHFFGGRGAPGPVDGCVDGASRSSGVLNLAGNAMEWLDGGWLIGAGFSGNVFGGAVDYRRPVDGQDSWSFDFLRDEIPGRVAFAKFDDRKDLKNKYDSYRVPPDDADAQFVLREAGLRCVLNLE